jgi:hypothetical protein
MARKSESVSHPVFQTPMRLDWTDEKLQTLTQEQLLNLLDNLDRQRSIGRVSEHAAAAFDQRITALLTGRNGAKRRKQVLGNAATLPEET